jgi:predicted metalloprotease
METEGRRQSDNFEDRGRGDGGPSRAGAGLPIQLLFGLFRVLGFKGTLVVGALALGGYFLLPTGLKQQLFGGDQAPAQGGPGTGSVCKASPSNAKACEFSRVVLASTEDVWSAKFRGGELPSYGRAPGPYVDPTLVVFAEAVSTDCGTATSAVGPFYCPSDRRLYIDPSFYQVMERRLRAPGDFAQAYVIAHEVGHHVQNLIGASDHHVRGESKNETSVRTELQADCLAGVWGHTARAALAINDEDLREAVNAAHAIGDDALGNTNAAAQTHGTSAQRMRWFRRGFDSGDARQCNTFQVAGRGLL